MTIAFDATSGSAALINTATTTNWTHTPAGVPRAVVVLIPQGINTDQVSAVTYGGVALSRVRFNARAVTETCGVYIYFLGVSIPTGAQTMAVTTTGTNPMWPQAITYTAAQNTVVNVQAGLDAGATVTNPSLALSPTGQAGLAYVCASGLNAPVSTPQAGLTQAAARDLGTISGHMGYKVVSAGATTVGWTSAAEDVCHAGVGITELAVVLGAARAIVVPTNAVHRSRSW